MGNLTTFLPMLIPKQLSKGYWHKSYGPRIRSLGQYEQVRDIIMSTGAGKAGRFLD
ncbi:MAG TPA: hypothetical protein VFZ67_07535 [Nitrososphaera sp.]